MRAELKPITLTLALVHLTYDVIAQYFILGNIFLPKSLGSMTMRMLI